MRLPIKDNSNFAKSTNCAFENLRNMYLESIKPQLLMKEVNVMMADGSITQANTFEPQKVVSFFHCLIESLKEWTTTGISNSSTDDLRRIYCQFTQEVGKYYLHGYFGIQFHALPYYIADKRVIQIQRELANIAEKANETFKLMSKRGNDVVHKELGNPGNSEMEFEEFFNKLFEDNKLLEHLEKKALLVEQEFPEFNEMHNRKIQLFDELEKLVLELYQISPVLMDYDKLMQGEEGVTTYFDVEVIRNRKPKGRDSYVDTKKIDVESSQLIVQKLSTVAKVLQNISQ